MIILYSAVFGFCLDLLFSDSHKIPHPVLFIGKLIGFLDKKLRNPAHSPKKQTILGALTVLIVLLSVFSITALLVYIAYKIHPILAVVIEILLCFSSCATKSLKKESMAVFYALEENDIPKARHALSMIVGRDTQNLSEEQIVRAAVETVAENASDGVIAPMMYFIIGGGIFSYIYKAVNTMDSMLGYKNDKYLYFGRAAAKLDDVFNYIPSRFCAFAMMAASFFCGMDIKNAFKIFKRDRFNHQSPNSAQTESVCAGAMRIQLAGDSYYFGKLVKKKTIGDALRPVQRQDIKRANTLLYATATISFAVLIGIRIILLLII